LRRSLSMCAALLATLFVVACGDTDTDSTPAAGESDATRTVRHAMGTTNITGTPARVVVLDTGELDSAVALGLKPVGAVEAIAGEGLPAYLGDAVRDIKLVGTIEQPNVEAIAALRPDLILSSKVRHEAIYDQLARVAPTVFSEEVGVTWKENFALHARALGLSDQGRRLRAEYEETARDLRNALGEKRAGITVSVVRSVGDEVRIYLKANFLGTILDDAGLPRPKSQNKDEFSETATTERIADLDGDLMILSRFGNDHRLLKRLQDNRLWARLDVVKAERVFEVPDDLWFLGIGNFAARKVLDDLRTVVLDGRRLPGDDGNPRTA
jgi:iron complex transport system substrate-binding protein